VPRAEQSDAQVVDWVEKTVVERQPTAPDKRFDEIGWSPTFAPRFGSARSTTARSFSTPETAASLASLGRAVAQFKPQPGNPVVTPRPQSVSPPAAADAVTLHLISRGDDRGSWGAFPAESWIVLDRGDWSKLLPTAAVSPGQTWGLDQDVSARILTYPGRKDAQPIEAQVVGLLIFAPGQPPTLELTTKQGRSQNADLHGGGPNRSAPAPITASPVGASRECRNPSW
jgi:hypothetical protein